MRLTELEKKYASIFNRSNDTQVLLAAIAHNKAQADSYGTEARKREMEGYVFTTRCLLKRGNIPTAASDLNVIKSLINLTSKSVTEAYDKKDSASLGRMQDMAKNYKYRVLEAKLALSLLK